MKQLIKGFHNIFNSVEGNRVLIDPLRLEGVALASSSSGSLRPPPLNTLQASPRVVRHLGNKRIREECCDWLFLFSFLFLLFFLK